MSHAVHRATYDLIATLVSIFRFILSALHYKRLKAVVFSRQNVQCVHSPSDRMGRQVIGNDTFNGRHAIHTVIDGVRLY